ncbi:OmpL47-type beta-barrel domain-containing protein, partial [Salirhabdus salicampi]|uniref:OmpL47-type beta-barrel domain-containing protein n=1 Tax=Salirhabdus salicampi TaxID=476102 RepID=UPI0020C3E487
TVELTATDNLSGVEKTYYSVNGSEFKEGTSFVVTEEGVNEVSFYSVDKAGNVEDANTVEVMLDKTPPVTESNVTDEWLKDDFTVELTATDNLSGVEKTYYSVNGSEFKEGTSFVVTEEGVNEVSYYSVDKAGNVEEANSVEVKIDKTAPVVIDGFEEEYELGQDIKLTYFAFDSISGIASQSITVNGEEYEKGDLFSLDQPGDYTVKVEVTDHAGWQTTVEKQFTVYIPADVKVLSGSNNGKSSNDKGKKPNQGNGNNGIFNVKVSISEEFEPGFELTTVTVNGVNAVAQNEGNEQLANQGKFKFARKDFGWSVIQGQNKANNSNYEEVQVEFRGYNTEGHLVIGSTTIYVK